MPPACVINCDDAHESKIGTDLNLTSLIHGIDSVAMSNDIRIGTQGWNYEAWVGPQWSLGGMLRLMGSVTREEESNATYAASIGAATLSFTALYH